MIKLMIVDDESSIRRGLKKYIDWNAWGISLVAEATDGQEAFDRALEVRPDILISDIRMPHKDGLALCRLLRESIPEIRIILLTGHDRTDYLHAALEYGVHDYLLKPASADKIISCVLKCKEEIMEERNKKAEKLTRDAFLDESIPILQTALINDLLEGNIEQTPRLMHQSEMLGIPLDGPFFQTIVMNIRISNGEECHSLMEQEMMYWQLIQKVESICMTGRDFFCEMAPGEYFILINAAGAAEAESKSYKMAERLVVDIGHNDGRHIVIGIGTVVSDVLELAESYKVAQNAFRASAWKRDQQIFMPEDAHEGKFPPEAVIEVKHALAALAMGKNCADEVTRLFSVCRKENTDIRRLRHYLSQILSLCRRMNESGEGSELGDFEEYQLADFLYADELEKWTLEYLDTYCGNAENRSGVESQMIAKAIVYMREHYQEKITLQSLAKKLFISPNYLGRVFRDEMGCKFSDWLNHYRVDCAKELMDSTDMRTMDIAERVGFGNYKYFSVCFAKYAGCSLRDYRNQNRKLR